MHLLLFMHTAIEEQRTVLWGPTSPLC